MSPRDHIHLVGGLLDLPILDAEGRYCGIVDDVELESEGGAALRVQALLVGPGAYNGRLPGWAMRLTRWVAGDRLSRVPWDAITEIGSAVTLRVTADELGLLDVENRARRLIPHKGAL